MRTYHPDQQKQRRINKRHSYPLLGKRSRYLKNSPIVWITFEQAQSNQIRWFIYGSVRGCVERKLQATLLLGNGACLLGLLGRFGAFRQGCVCGLVDGLWRKWEDLLSYLGTYLVDWVPFGDFESGISIVCQPVDRSVKIIPDLEQVLLLILLHC